MSSFTIGLLGSLASCILWASAVILFRKTADHVTAFGLNVGKNLVGFLFFTLTLLIMGHNLFPAIPLKDFLYLAISGVVGVGIGDMLFMKSLKMLGAGFNAIVSCLYTPLMILAGVFIFSETISIRLILGAILVVSAIVVSSLDDMDKRPKHLVTGILIGTLSILANVTGAVLFKGLLHRYSLFYIIWVRLFMGCLFLLLFYVFHPKRRELLSGLELSRNWVGLGISGILGTYLAILAWTLGLRHLPVSLIAVFSQLTVIMIIVLAYFFLREQLSIRRMVSAALAVGGAFITLVGA